MARSTFSPLGLPIGNNNTNMTYLYGISDFFSVMFADPDKINLLLETNTQMYSQVYSRFLQMTANISLENIQETCGQTLRLITLNSTDAVPGKVNVYNLPENIVSSRYIANLPLLPSTLLEQNVDYGITISSTGQYQITFAKNITQNGFSSRLLSDGTTIQYALWFVDTEIDELWMSTNFGNMIGISPQESTQAFNNFVYGMYYLYVNGPTLDLMRKGLNLALGLPLCRGNETVLDIQTYLETDLYIVITDKNQYIIPYGLQPIVTIGQQLTISQELAVWVDVKDYEDDGAWWINLQIPESIIPSLPPGQPNRYALAGSQFDYLMRNYLKTHTFLVNVNVTTFEDTQFFEQIGNIIQRAKPSYTQAIYIWTVEQDEVLTLSENVTINLQQNRWENVLEPIGRMIRHNTHDPLLRGDPCFLRCNVPMSVTRLCGTDAYSNGVTDSFNNGVVTGYVNPINQYRANTETERSWIRTVLDRGNEVITGNRGRVGFYRGINSEYDNAFNYEGVPSQVIAKMAKVGTNLRIIPLYITTQQDVASKFNSLLLTPPTLTQWTFTFLAPTTASDSIDSFAINYNNPGVGNTSQTLANNFNLAFFRGSEVQYLYSFMPSNQAYRSWAPPDASYVNPGDYILGIRIYENVIGMYWVTDNFLVQPNWYLPVSDSDPLNISLSTPISRGLGPMGSPYYLLRGRGYSGITQDGQAIDAEVIDGAITNSTIVVVNPYSDTLNTSPVTFTRGTNLPAINHQMELN